MKSEICENSKKLISEKLFLKYVSYNKLNKKDSKKTIAFSNFFDKMVTEFLIITRNLIEKISY
jgi:hypothetical protein